MMRQVWKLPDFLMIGWHSLAAEQEMFLMIGWHSLAAEQGTI